MLLLIFPGCEGLKGGAPSKLLKGLLTADSEELDVTPFEDDHDKEYLFILMQPLQKYNSGKSNFREPFNQ